MPVKEVIEKYLFLILLFIPLFILFVLRFVFHFDGLFGQDAYEYERYTRELNSFYLTGIEPGEIYWPVNYCYAGSLFYELFPRPGLMLQLVSCFSVSIACYYTIKLIAILYNVERSSVFYFAVVFLIFSPYVFRNSFAAMPDLMASALIIASIYYSILFFNNRLPRYFYIFCMLAAFSFFTKHASAVILFVPFVAGIFYLLKKKPVSLLMVPVLIFVAVLPELILKQELSGFGKMILQLQWDFMNFFKNSFTTTEGSTDYFLPGITYGFQNIFHPGFFFAGSVLLFFMILKRNQIKISKPHIIYFVLPVVLYALFLAGIPRQNDRFLIMSFPLILILLFPAWLLFYSGLNKFAAAICIVLFLSVNIILSFYAFRGIYSRNQFEQAAAKDIINSEIKMLYTFEADLAMIERGYKGHIINFYKLDIHSYSQGALVLVNENNIESQWESKRPDKNLKLLKENYRLELINDYENEWKLYKITGKKN